MRSQGRNSLAVVLILTLSLLCGAVFAANDFQGSDMVRIGG